MNEKIRVINLNAEYGFSGPHSEQLLPFVEEHKPDVLCLQEVFPRDIERLLATGLFITAEHLPQATFHEGHVKRNERLSAGGPWGIAILTNLAVTGWNKDYYTQRPNGVPEVHDYGYDPHRGILSANLQTKSGASLNIGTIHYIWTPDGSVSPEQRWTIRDVNRIVSERRLDVLTGDMNIPRGNRLATMLEQGLFYKSHVPETVVTTMDNERHRNKNIPNHVVDYALTTVGSRWEVCSIVVRSGVSDHCALLLEVGENNL